MQLGLNAAFGFVIGVGLWLIGVPSAPLWGMMAMILRFVPYVGALIAAVFPLLLAAAVDPDWTMVLLTAALFTRFRSREENPFGERLLAALRQQFGGHAVKPGGSEPGH